MHAAKLLHKLFKNTCASIDKRVQKTLFFAADTLSRCKTLSIFGLGRALKTTTQVKHNIKRMDRLVGNVKLAQRRGVLYQAMAMLLLQGNSRPTLLVDWSGLTPCGGYHFLRASIAVGGRALTLYEEVFAQKHYGNDKIHRQFLQTLKTILPEASCPIIVTDAGFRNPWFRAVSKLGWHFVGRIRHTTQYCFEGSQLWHPIKHLYESATPTARFLGLAKLARARSMSCYFYIMRQVKKHRVKRNLAGKKVQCSVSKKHEKREREPWLLASSLSPEIISALSIMNLYKKRMQIEQAFRDLKNSRNGLGLRHSRTGTSTRLKKSTAEARLHVMLLIATIAIFLLWIIGTAAKQQSLQYAFQANSIKHKNVLSNFTIGWQLLSQNIIQFTYQELLHSLHSIAEATKEIDLC